MRVKVADMCSSDDDIDILLHGTSEQRQKLRKRQGLRQDEEETSSEDEFEKEMASELDAKMKQIEKHWASGPCFRHFMNILQLVIHTRM